ncbi:MAG: SAM-dependent methyltransferase [Xenococcaceae cyanobacterium MO_207.B15]|nr:SAM-dependent methyltransferase [Xenococcaceae cyanobacterium MO_207.B15]
MTNDFTIDNVFPWGRALAEYTRMFALSEKDLQSSILDCGGGPSSFNSEQYNAGNLVISCDPIYQFTAEQIQNRIQATYPLIMEGLQVNYDKFVWQDITSPEHLAEVRMSAMKKFLNDFPEGLKQGRYLNASLPNLPFTNQQFDIALCSNFLFTYSQEFSLEFHLQSILEMCRVAKDVRVFPLVEIFTGAVSPHLNPIITRLRDRGYQVNIEQVEYEFQINGNQMLHVY